MCVSQCDKIVVPVIPMCDFGFKAFPFVCTVAHVHSSVVFTRVTMYTMVNVIFIHTIQGSPREYNIICI